jgi:hypothetical protein
MLLSEGADDTATLGVLSPLDIIRWKGSGQGTARNITAVYIMAVEGATEAPTTTPIVDVSGVRAKRRQAAIQDRREHATNEVSAVIAALSASHASTRKIGSALAPLIADLPETMTLGALLQRSVDDVTGDRLDVRDWCTRKQLKRVLTVYGLFDARRVVETALGDVLNLPGVGHASAGELVVALALALASVEQTATSCG